MQPRGSPIRLLCDKRNFLLVSFSQSSFSDFTDHLLHVITQINLFLDDLKSPVTETVKNKLYCIAFIHFYSAIHSLSEALPTTAMTLCRSLQAGALQATASEVLTQGPYLSARAGFEPATLQWKGIDSTSAPPSSTSYLHDCINAIHCSQPS